MQIKQDPITKLYCREDGAVFIPKSGTRPAHWTFGFKRPDGYRVVGYNRKLYQVHQLICRAFHGLPPEGKPEVDHLDRDPSNNKEANLRWTDRSGNNTNRGCVDASIEKYGVRECEDKKTYSKAYSKAYAPARRAKMRAQGLTWRKGPNGKWGWYPFKRTTNQKE